MKTLLLSALSLIAVPAFACHGDNCHEHDEVEVQTTNVVVANEDGSVTILEPRVIAMGEEEVRVSARSSVTGVCVLKGYGQGMSFEPAIYRNVRDEGGILVNAPFVGLSDEGRISYTGRDNAFSYFSSVTCALAE